MLAGIGQQFQPTDDRTYDGLVQGVGRELLQYFRPAHGTGHEVDEIVAPLGLVQQVPGGDDDAPILVVGVAIQVQHRVEVELVAGAWLPVPGR